MIRYFLFAVATSACFAQVTAPSLGLLPDGADLRIVVGIPAAGVVGPALDNPPKLLRSSAAQDFAIGVSVDSGSVLRVSLDGNSSRIDAPANPDLIVLSPLGSAAALWYAASHRVQILSGLP